MIVVRGCPDKERHRFKVILRICGGLWSTHHYLGVSSSGPRGVGAGMNSFTPPDPPICSLVVCLPSPCTPTF